MITKYSMGGPITSIEDEDSVEQMEENNVIAAQENFIIICKKCGIQHMMLKVETRVCCGIVMEFDKLS